MKLIALLLLALVMVAGATACSYENPVLETTALPQGIVGIWYDFAIEANNGDGAVYWTVERGTLPLDLKLDQVHGRITGYPKSVGAYPVLICVHNAVLSVDNKDCREFTLTITAAP